MGIFTWSIGVQTLDWATIRVNSRVAFKMASYVFGTVSAKSIN